MKTIRTLISKFLTILCGKHDKPRLGGVCFFCRLFLLPPGLQAFQFDSVVMGFMLGMEHAYQFALLVHIPDAYTRSQDFVGHSVVVVLSYFDSHLQTPIQLPAAPCRRSLL